MSRQPWTHGPWSWREGGEHFHVDAFASGTIAIAFGSEVTSTGGVTGVTGDEGEANARLLAQAPALAEALAEFVRIYDRHIGSGARGNTVPIDPPEITRARNVLDAIGWRWP